MLSRRELLSAGVAGSLITEPSPPAIERQPSNREVQEEIASNIERVENAIRELNPVTLSQGPVDRIRDLMARHLRSSGKFPDFLEVGIDIYFAMYDWHVKYEQPLVSVRQTDGRYHLQFMFTTLILRQDYDATFIGTPFDRG